ncbi:MAG: hypothetical protein WBP81_17275 [Solirubrobacteraceae bacterium]
MARIPLPNDDELDERALALLGVLPKLNVARMLARTGIAPEFYAVLGKLFQEDFLAPDDREVILFRVCRNNGSTYEIPQHRAFSGLSDQIVDGILEDRLDVLDLWHRSLCLMCDEICKQGRLSDDSVASLVTHYNGPNGACRAILVMSWFNMLTRYVDSTGVPPETGDNPYRRMTGPAVGGTS